MNWFLQPILLSCRHAAELVDKSPVEKLTWLQKRQLGWHLSACKGCKAYEKQSQFLGQLLDYQSKENINFFPGELNLEAFEAQVLARLKSLK